MRFSTLVAAGLIAGTSALAATSASADQIDRRQANQERRIEEARRSGQLTYREYRQLESEQARIRALERNARADGHVDRSEQARINAAQNAAERHIYAESHDAERRGSGWNRWRRWSRWW